MILFGLLLMNLVVPLGIRAMHQDPILVMLPLQTIMLVQPMTRHLPLLPILVQPLVQIMQIVLVITLAHMKLMDLIKSLHQVIVPLNQEPLWVVLQSLK